VSTGAVQPMAKVLAVAKPCGPHTRTLNAGSQNKPVVQRFGRITHIFEDTTQWLGGSVALLWLTEDRTQSGEPI